MKRSAVGGRGGTGEVRKTGLEAQEELKEVGGEWEFEREKREEEGER